MLKSCPHIALEIYPTLGCQQQGDPAWLREHVSMTGKGLDA